MRCCPSLIRLTQGLLTVGALGAIAVTAHADSAAAANLVANGDFEDVSELNYGSWGTAESISGWQATTGSYLEIQKNGVAGDPFSGNHLLELDSHNYGKDIDTLGIFQDVVTQPGRRYRLSFAYSARPGRAASDNRFEVSFGDTLVSQIEAGAGQSNTDWHLFQGTVTATEALSRLQFTYTGELNTFGAYIDQVSLEAVPEPTLLLGLASVAAAGFALKRSKTA